MIKKLALLCLSHWLIQSSANNHLQLVTSVRDVKQLILAYLDRWERYYTYQSDEPIIDISYADNQYLICAHQDKIRFMNVHKLELPADTFYPNYKDISAVTFSPQSKHLAIGYESGRFKLYHLDHNGTLQARMNFVFTGKVNAISFSSDDQYVAVGDNNNYMRVYTITYRKMLYQKSFEAPIKSIAFAPDNNSIALGLSDNTAHIFHTYTQEIDKIVSNTKLIKLGIQNVSFSSDNNFLITTDGSSLNIWELKERRLIEELSHPAGYNYAACAPHDSSYVAVAPTNLCARMIWCKKPNSQSLLSHKFIDCVAHSECIEKKRCQEKPECIVKKIIFSRDGAYIAMGSSHSATIWKNQKIELL
jgi:WD40 repeat protein